MTDVVDIAQFKNRLEGTKACEAREADLQFQIWHDDAGDIIASSIIGDARTPIATLEDKLAIIRIALKTAARVASSFADDPLEEGEGGKAWQCEPIAVAAILRGTWSISMAVEFWLYEADQTFWHRLNVAAWVVRQTVAMGRVVGRDCFRLVLRPKSLGK